MSTRVTDEFVLNFPNGLIRVTGVPGGVALEIVGQNTETAGRLLSCDHAILIGDQLIQFGKGGGIRHD